MSAHQATTGRGAVASALTAVADWLVEPADQVVAPPEALDVAERPVIAVTGLRHRAGVTVVARALAAALAGRDPGGTCVVTADSGSGPHSFGLPAAGRLARALGPLAPGGTRAAGRLCLVRGADRVVLAAQLRGLAPLVIDVSDPAQATAAASLADGVVLVAAPVAEPALAAVVAESLTSVGPAPVVVVNRAGKAVDDAWERIADLSFPESRIGARTALSGREARGGFGDAVAELADRWAR